MSQRLKRWESPRKEGRNDKGKGGSARQRQKKKQFQMLRKKLKSQTRSQTKRESASRLSFCLGSCLGLMVSSGADLLSKVGIANFMKIVIVQ
jgi:hypothetical protein